MKPSLAITLTAAIVLAMGQLCLAQQIDYPGPPLPGDSTIFQGTASPAPVQQPTLHELVPVPSADAPEAPVSIPSLLSKAPLSKDQVAQLPAPKPPVTESLLSKAPVPLPVVDIAYESFYQDVAATPEASDYTQDALDSDPGFWAPFGCTSPCWRFYGEFMYIRARNAELPFAVPIDAVGGNPPIQVGPTAVLDPEYNPGFRVGLGRAWDCCSHIKLEYSHYESNVFGQSSIPAPDVIRSMVLHPGTAGAAADWNGARANYGIDFDLADLDYRRIWDCSDLYTIRYLIGMRYAGLTQNFRSTFLGLANNTANADVRFDGGGIRLGLEAERHAANSGLMLYGRAVASFVAGDFRTQYEQRQLGVPVAYNSWKAGRVISMLDLEIGIGWVSQCDTVRFNAGYMMSGWYNTVTTSEYIGAVQANDFSGMGQLLSFDGLTARVELRF